MIDIYNFIELITKITELKDNVDIKTIFDIFNIDINKKYEDNRNLLILAIFKSNKIVINYLLDNMININETDNEGWNALHYAINESCSPSIIKMILEYGINIFQQDNYGFTALMYLTINTKYNDSDFCEILDLLMSDEVCKIKDNKGKNFYDHAKENIIDEYRKNLILSIKNNDNIVNIQNNKNKTALMIALENNNYEVVKLLLKKKISLSLKDIYGNDIIDYIIINKYFRNMKMMELLKNYVDCNNETIYFLLAKKNIDFKIIKYFL